MKSILRTLLLVVLMLGLVGMSSVMADCDNTGSAGNDTIICNNDPVPPDTYVGGQGGDDTIIIEEGTSVIGVAGDANGTPTSLYISNGSGSDTIVVNGTTGYVLGDLSTAPNGDDNITIGSTGSASNVYGDNGNFLNSDGGDDTITIAGTVEGVVEGQAGSDTIVLQNGADGGLDNTLYIYGGPGNDTLVFEFTIGNQAVYDELAAMIANNVSSGSITINGQTYVWYDFESLINLLTFVLGYGEGSSGDNRLNNDAGQTAVVYCAPEGGVTVLAVNAQSQGYFLYTAGWNDVDGALNQAIQSAQNTPIISADGQSLWALTGQSEQRTVLLHDDAGRYDFTFDADQCAPPETT